MDIYEPPHRLPLSVLFDPPSKRVRRPLPIPFIPEKEGKREPRILNSVKPDLTVIVGGQECLHYSLLLRYASNYFDALLQHDMK
jgi:hypothetical protein